MPAVISQEAAESSRTEGASARGSFGYGDIVGIVVGIVVGTAIFKTPTLVFQNTPGPGWALGLWVVGGLLSLCGALCYAELATTYPGAGGDYEYLTRAYGRWVGFLFGWTQLVVILSSSIAAMAYAFGDYAVRLVGCSQEGARYRWQRVLSLRCLLSISVVCDQESSSRIC